MKFFRWLNILLILCGNAAALDLSEIEKDGAVQRGDGSDLGIMIMGTITNKKNPAKNVALVKENGKIRAIKQKMVILKEYRVAIVQEKFIVIGKKDVRHLIYQDKFANEFKRTAPKKESNDLLFAEDGFERRKSSITMTAAYRDNIVKKDLQNILMQATAIPHYQSGEIVGFKLLQIDRNSIYDKSGFMDHDVITSINGNKLNSASGAIKLLNSLKGATDIKIEYIRFGEAKSMDISIN